MAAPIAQESSELEAMRKEDRSWHPCRVSLSTGPPVTLSVMIGSKSYAEEYTITSKDEVRSYLRYRSIPIQDGECNNIEEGDKVIAVDKEGKKNLFFDAVIEKVQKVKHSKRVYCRCTFEVKWLQSERQSEPVILSSSLIMKLSNKSIDGHSVVAEFFSFINGMKSSGISLSEERTPEADVFGLPEYDVHLILEKQIEELSKFADSSKGSYMEGIDRDHADANLSVHKQTNGNTRTATVNRQPSLRSSTNSQRRKKLELDVKKQIEESSFLTPLAARAALASLMHDLPDSEISDYAAKKEIADIPSSIRNLTHTLNNVQKFNATIPKHLSEPKSHMHQSRSGSESYLDHHKPTTRLTRSKAQKGHAAPNGGGKCHGEDRKANMRLTRSKIEDGNRDSVDEGCKKSHDQEPRKKQLISEILLDGFDDVDVSPAKVQTNGENVALPPYDGNSESTKGTKRTRIARADVDRNVKKVEKSIDDGSHPNKLKSVSSTKPGLRSSPRLRLLQSNGSTK